MYGTRQNYIIEYQALDATGKIIKEGKIKAKNKLSKFDAQCGFEEHLKKTLPNFSRLIVKKCVEDYFGIFSQIFK